MKTRRIYQVVAGALALGLAACTSGQGDVDVIEQHVASIPVPAEGAALAGVSVTVETSFAFDASSELADISRFGALDGSISSHTLSGDDLTFLTHVRATITNADGSSPVELLSDVDVPAGSTVAHLPLSMPASDVIADLAEGPVTVDLQITGAIPDHPLTLTHAMTAHVSLAVSPRPVTNF